MKKYFLNYGTSQLGPFTIEELQARNITADTAIWHDGLPEWTTAGQLEELKDIIVHTPPPFHTPEPDGEVKPATVTAEPVPVVTTTTAATVMSAPTPLKSSKKKTAWLSWVLYLLIFGGVGYFVYQDMEKNKGNREDAAEMSDMDSDENEDEDENDGDDTVDDADTDDEKTPENETDQTGVTKDQPVITTTAERPTADVKETQPPVSNTAKTNQPVVVNEKAKSNVTTSKTKQAEIQKAAQLKAEEERKKLQAAATLSKEKEYRNNWPKYITMGKIDFKANDDGVDAFNIPVYNGTNATLDKVTLRIDYMKKEKKVLKSETVVVYGIPPGAGLNGRAPESKKGNNVKVYITGINSKKLHFCYPVNNGNMDDPYYCN